MKKSLWGNLVVVKLERASLLCYLSDLSRNAMKVKSTCFFLKYFVYLRFFSINVKLKCVSVCGMNTVKYQQFVPSLSELLHRGLYICSVCITERQEEIMSKNKTAMTW